MDIFIAPALPRFVHAAASYFYSPLKPKVD